MHKDILRPLTRLALYGTLLGMTACSAGTDQNIAPIQKASKVENSTPVKAVEWNIELPLEQVEPHFMHASRLLSVSEEASIRSRCGRLSTTREGTGVRIETPTTPDCASRMKVMQP